MQVVDASPSPKHVLVLDDEKALCEVLAEVLGTAGYEVTAAHDAEHALAAVKERDFGVAILDKNLPGGKTGLDVLTAARKVRPTLHVMIYTGYPSLESAIEAMQGGAFDYIEKPIDNDLLVEKVRRAWNSYALTVERLELFRKYEALFEIVPGIVWFMTEDGLIKRINREGAAMLGYEPEELVNQPYERLLPANETRSSVHWAFKERRTGQRATRRQTIELRTRSGATKVFEINSTGAYDRTVQEASKLFWGTLGVGWDVTDHASLEEQLQQARKMEAIGRLAGGVAHDFNNLLSVILSNVELFKNAMPEGHPHHSDVMDVESAALRGADLTRQLLAFARKQVVRPRPTHFVDVVRGLEPLLRRLITENISLECTLPGRVAMVEADPSQLEQVVINLAVNARDAMPKGGRLTIQTCDVHLDPEFAASHLQVTPGDYVMLAVADDGSGMSPEVRAHLFEPFYTTKEVGRGTGLGLATVYGIVTQLGGHISVYSEAETGTCIKVYLPALPAGTAAVVEPADGATHLDGNEVILVVEDDELVRRLARRVLTRHGYTVYEAPDGDLGEVLAAEHEPDLVLTDMVMPKMGGGELAQRLRARFPRLPIVYMSGYVGHVMPQPDRLTDGADFLQKPFTASGLLAAVRKLLDQR